MNIEKLINDSINQRSQIWREYNRAVANEQELTIKFSQEFDSSDSVIEINPLTPQNTPPLEVFAAITNLEQIQQDITQAQSNIQYSENESETLKTKAKKLIIALSVIGIIGIGSLIIYLKNQAKDNSSSSQNLTTPARVVYLSPNLP